MLFQFHKGTIKTNAGAIVDVNSKLFQFHKGTIKTADDVVASVVSEVSIP